MAVPTHFRFNIRGDFATSPETWNFGFHMSRSQSGSIDAGLGDVHEDEVDAAVATFFGNTFLSNRVRALEWRCYVVGTNGKMEGNGPKISTFDTPITGGGSHGSAHPPQVSLAVTTVANNRGSAKLGRFYLPGVNSAIADDWRITDGTAATIATAATQLLKDVSDAIDFVALGSASGVNVSPGPVGSSTGTLQQIDHVEVGRCFDTIRNRRKSLLEERHVGGSIDW